MGLKMKKIFIVCLLINTIFVGSAMSGWEGPEEIVKGKWGIDKGEFGIAYGGAIDEFPRHPDISINNKNEIFIADEINKRLCIYDREGIFLNHKYPYSVNRRAIMTHF